MKIAEIIKGLEEQAAEKDRLSGGDPGSHFTRDADVLMEASRILRRMSERMDHNGKNKM